MSTQINSHPTPPSPVVQPEFQGPKKKKTVVVPALVGFAVLLAAGLFWRSRSAGGGAEAGGARSGQGAGRDRTPTVKVVSVTNQTLVQNIAVTGQLKTSQNVDLNAKISGRVARVLVDEGQRVSRGQLLVELDTADLQQSVENAHANLQSAQVRLEQTRLNLPSRVAQVNSGVSSAQAALENARAATNSANARYRQALLSEPARITNARSQVDTAQAAVNAANARLKTARDNVRLTQGQVNAGIASAQAALLQSRAQLEQVRNGSRAQQVAQAQAQVGAAEAQVANAQAQLANARTNLERQQLLFNGGATAQASVDSAKTQFDVAQTQLNLAQSQLEAQRQNLSLVREGARTEEVTAAEQSVSQREAGLRSAQADRNRILAAQSQVSEALAGVAQAQEGLRQAQANLSQIPITRQETRTALESLRQAQAQESSARVALQQARVNTSQIPGLRADVPAAQSAVNSARVALNQTLLNLSYARVSSPVNGVVNTKFADVGESASPGAPLLNLVALDNVYFEAQIPESQLAQIRVGQPARVTVNAVSNTPIIGYVTEIIPVADERLRQFRLRISLPQRRGLTPGAFARGQLQTNVIRGALTVPTELVRNEDGRSFIYVARGGQQATIQKRTVKVGASADGRTQIIGNISSDTKVVTGNQLFDDGAKVKTVSA